ncbi:MAG: hypothetical protein JXB15_13970 [Anaerolineales bacterium]|nr:hypothetical protein [Anaerolineales bacterium]
MKKHDYIRIITTAALVVIAAAALASAYTYASSASASGGGVVRQTDLLAEPAGDPVPGGPGFISFGPMVFTGWPTNLGYYYSGTRLRNPDASFSYFLANVLLPHGTTITKFLVFYYDNHASYNLDAILIRTLLEQDSGNTIASVTSSGTATTIRNMEDTTIITPVVDNQSFQYIIQIILPPTLDVGLVSIRIDYAYGVSLPRVTK